MKKALMIAGIVLFTVLTIHIITNSSIGSSGSTTKTVVVHDNNPHRYYYGYGNPHYNSYKAQYYN